MMRKCALVLSLLLVITAPLLIAGPSRAGDQDTVRNFGLKGVITLPGTERVQRFDISWVDHPSQTYYLADRTNRQIDVVDARTDTFVQALAHGQFVGFTGNNDTSGPNGILVIESLHELWAGDGPSNDPVCAPAPCSTVKVIDLKATPPAIVATISTGGTARADEMAFDPDDHILVVANDADAIPYVSFISTDTRRVLGTLAFPDATENGLEQSVWDSATRRFYLNVPNPGGDSYIAQIDPRTRKITNRFHVGTCEGGGLALTPHQHLIVGCQTQETLIVDARTGMTVAMTTEVGGSDQVWFNPGDGNYYLAARNNMPVPVLGIIDAATNLVLGKVPTGSRGVHSVAANRANNHVFVPLPPGSATGSFPCPNGCIGVYFSDGN